MSVNKYKPHLWVIPEDDANRQLLSGFLLHDGIAHRYVGVRKPAGGWHNVIAVFETEYVPLLRKHPAGHALLLIDFDNQFPVRFNQLRQAIPQDLAERVFALGALGEPEDFRRLWKSSFEEIGTQLADGCFREDWTPWHHEQLRHNESERQRLATAVRSFLIS